MIVPASFLHFEPDLANIQSNLQDEQPGSRKPHKSLLAHAGHYMLPESNDQINKTQNSWGHSRQRSLARCISAGVIYDDAGGISHATIETQVDPAAEGDGDPGS